MKPVVFHPEAQADLIGAVAFYDGQREGLGERLLESVERAIGRISNRPHSFSQSTDQGHRKCRVEGFPYALHFVESEAEIWILAVAHNRRDPKYWRLREPR